MGSTVPFFSAKEGAPLRGGGTGMGLASGGALPVLLLPLLGSAFSSGCSTGAAPLAPAVMVTTVFAESTAGAVGVDLLAANTPAARVAMTAKPILRSAVSPSAAALPLLLSCGLGVGSVTFTPPPRLLAAASTTFAAAMGFTMSAAPCRSVEPDRPEPPSPTPPFPSSNSAPSSKSDATWPAGRPLTSALTLEYFLCCMYAKAKAAMRSPPQTPSTAT